MRSRGAAERSQGAERGETIRKEENEERKNKTRIKRKKDARSLIQMEREWRTEILTWRSPDMAFGAVLDANGREKNDGGARATTATTDDDDGGRRRQTTTTTKKKKETKPLLVSMARQGVGWMRGGSVRY